MNDRHWTRENLENLIYSTAADFFCDLEVFMEESGTTSKQLAAKLGCSAGAVSQQLNCSLNNGNVEVATIVKYVEALGLKVAIVAYKDSRDVESVKGPVLASVFRRSWQKLGEPQDLFYFNES